MRILFSMVSVNKIETDQIELLVESAKVYFLKDHQIDFTVFTNLPNPEKISDINFIQIDTEPITCSYYYYFQKILSLNYVNLDHYDYVFVHDIDQVYVGPVVDADLLTNDFCLLQHFTNINAKHAVQVYSDVVQIDRSDLLFTMGNFWGGPSHLIKLLVSYVTQFWEIHKNHNFNGIGFFSMHADEVLLIKFIDYYRIREKRITSSIIFEIPAFLTAITNNGAVHDNLQNFKLIHDTKVNLNWAKQLFLNSIKIHQASSSY